MDAIKVLVGRTCKGMPKQETNGATPRTSVSLMDGPGGRPARKTTNVSGT